MRFDAADKAGAFVEAMKGVGLQTRQLQSAHPGSEPWLVMVSTGEPVLSPGFERKDAQIREAARRTGGFYQGWGGAAPQQPSGAT